jgi:hypothetical protein
LNTSNLELDINQIIKERITYKFKTYLKYMTQVDLHRSIENIKYKMEWETHNSIFDDNMFHPMVKIGPNYTDNEDQEILRKYLSEILTSILTFGVII